MNAVSCLTWIKRGASKGKPDQVKLTPDDLSRIVEEQGQRLKEIKVKDDDDYENDEEIDEEIETIMKNRKRKKIKKKKKVEEETENTNDIEKRYGLDDYSTDDEADEIDSRLNLMNIASFMNNSDDPMLEHKSEDNDTDEEDLRITPDDNVIVVGKVNNEQYCNLEMYVYNEYDKNLYCHHDIIISTFPLALEWLNFEFGEADVGNYVALGSISPHIEIWDVDLVNAIEPAFKLKGQKKTKKLAKKMKHSTTPPKGHTDAVLDLSWNQNHRSVLSSASADFMTGLWDLSTGKLVSMFDHHSEKVQTVEFHPAEKQTLLTGSFDQTACVLDCRTNQASGRRVWNLGGEVERVLWNTHCPYYFFGSTNVGNVYYFDVRADKPVFSLEAHSSAVTGVSVSQTYKNCLLTTSEDHYAKVWDISQPDPFLIYSNDLKLGTVHCASFSPDSGLIYAVGGERELKVINLENNSTVSAYFKSKPDVKTVTNNEIDESQSNICPEEVRAFNDSDKEEKEFFGESSATSAAASTKKLRKKKKKVKKPKVHSNNC